MIKKILKAFSPLIVAGIVFSYSLSLPDKVDIIASSLSPELPLHNDLPGWKGIKTQESETERQVLSEDTRFSKAIYRQLPRVPWEAESPPINVSLVYSGQDLNNSIHRPEVCLPAQGHLNLQGQTCEIELSNGKSLRLTRLTSTVPMRDAPKKRLNYIHYYVFVGHDVITHSHLTRNIQDTADRFLRGRVQSWAYFQVGSHWAPELGITEKEADARLQKLIKELLPGQIDWEKIK